MNDNQGRKQTKQVFMVIAVFVAIAAVFAGLWGLTTWRQEQGATQLTPELVVQAFKDANYEINDLQNVDTYPIPMNTADHAVHFSTHPKNDKKMVVYVYVLSYADDQQADTAASKLNDKNQSMGGTYFYAYRRGAIVLAVFVVSEDLSGKTQGRVAGEFNGVFRTTSAP